MANIAVRDVQMIIDVLENQKYEYNENIYSNSNNDIC